MSNQRKKDRNRLWKPLCFLLLCVLVFSVMACRKEQGKDEDSAIPTAQAGGDGFADANETLVKQRAEANAATTAVSVGDMDISMEKAMFFIYSMEVQGNSYSAYYESQYGMDYWEMVYDDEGHTTRDVFKEETMAALIQYAVLQDCARKNGMGLTAEEQAENKAFVEELKTLLSAEETERGGFTTENLTETCAWMMLGEKYYSKMTDSLGITREKVRETIRKEDYKEYKTEYLYLSTSYYDEEYTICQESEEVKLSAMAQMQDCYEQVLEGATFAELAAADDTLLYDTRYFLETGEEAEAQYKAAATVLENGEVCAPIQTEYGVYLIRMVDNACLKTYEETVETQYELQRSEAFEAAYEVLLAEYEVTVNEEVWDDIILGATVSILE